MDEQLDQIEIIVGRVATSFRATFELATTSCNRLRKALKIETDPQFAKINGLLARFEIAVRACEAAIKAPEVIISTTGTTSSGKSTLANVLIGADILPQAVLEMSAGVVFIRHDREHRSLRIHSTKGATWETGSWGNVEAREIREKLSSAMMEYRELVEQDRDSRSGSRTIAIEPPRFEIAWPTKLGSRAADYGLPSRAIVTIVDLPGLKYVGDELNSDVIKRASKGLCLVTYNSAEPDSKKQDALTRQIVDQVKALGGSPARMLFILNRIDVFLNDNNPDAAERSFTQKVTQRIRAAISEALEEHKTEANAIEPTPLSTEPALFAALAETAEDDNLAAYYLDELEYRYAKLFPKDRMRKLPRSKDEWSTEDRAWFIAEAKRGARIAAFESRLKQHITKNFPEILLPDLVKEAYEPARDAIQEMDAIAQAYTHATLDEVVKAAERLDELYEELRGIARKGLSRLDGLRELATGSEIDPERWVHELHDRVEEVANEIGLEENSFAPIASASWDSVYPPIRRLNKYTLSLMKEDTCDDDFVASTGGIGALHAAVACLKGSPYGNGSYEQEFESSSAIAEVRSSLSGFSRALAAVGTQVVSKETLIQVERVREALRHASDKIIEEIEEAAVKRLEKEGFEGLRGVFRNEFKIPQPNLSKVHFEADIERWQRTTTWKEPETYYEMRRVWYKLWLGKDLVARTRMVEKSSTRSGIRVDSFEGLLDAFEQSGEGALMLDSQLAAWMRDVIEQFGNALEEWLSQGIGTYRRALEGRKAEIERGAQVRIERINERIEDIRVAKNKLEASNRWRAVAGLQH